MFNLRIKILLIMSKFLKYRHFNFLECWKDLFRQFHQHHRKKSFNSLTITCFDLI
jgi:hypothetical protein